MTPAEVRTAPSGFSWRGLFSQQVIRQVIVSRAVLGFVITLKVR